MSLRVLRRLMVLAGAATALGRAQATTFEHVNLNPLVNADITTWTGGSGYPQNGGTLTMLGVPMKLATGANSRTGAVSFPNSTKEVVVNIPSPLRVYTLISSAWGLLGRTNGRVEFVTLGNQSYSVDLVQGQNIRDHVNGGYNNLASALRTSISYPTGVRFDQQEFVLPLSFYSDTLAKIRFVGTNNGNPAGSPIVISATVASVGCMVAGTLTLDEFLGSAEGESIRVELWQNGTLREKLTTAYLMGGAFEFRTVTTGNAVAKFQFRSGLVKSEPVELGDIPINDLNVLLLNGDVDRDNAVTVFDYGVLSDYFDWDSGRTGWAIAGPNGFAPKNADLDGDEAVTVFDYGILSSSFDEQGD